MEIFANRHFSAIEVGLRAAKILYMSSNTDQSNSTILLKNLDELGKKSQTENMQRNACLLGIDGAVSGQIFDLPTGVTTFGRNPENTFTLTVDGISRKHFMIEITEHDNETSATVKDLGSSNGTFVNDLKTPAKQLQKNDKITAGVAAFRFIPKGDPDRLAYDKLALAANTDKLTECFNKAYFLESMELEIKKTQKMGSPLSLIIFDLDHFKKLNDTYGHHAGDYVLKEMSKVIRTNGVREGDIFARYGGEEFVILLPKTNLKQAFEIAERIRKLVENHPFSYEGKPLKVTTSIGVADYRPGVVNGTDLFKRADKSVYTSKAKGRNQTNFFRE